MSEKSSLASKNVVERDEKGRILPGQNSLNPEGRPEGKSMKAFAREFLLKMNDDEKVKWLKSLGKDIVWRMAEGNPHQTSDIKGELEVKPILVKFIDVKDEDNRDTS